MREWVRVEGRKVLSSFGLGVDFKDFFSFKFFVVLDADLLSLT